MKADHNWFVGFAIRTIKAAVIVAAFSALIGAYGKLFMVFA